MLKHENLKLPDLVNTFMVYLEEIGYAKSTRKRLLAYYKVLIKYAKSNNIDYYSLDVGKTFLLTHHHHQWEETGKLTTSQNYLQRHIQILFEFQMYGEITTKKRLKRKYAVSYFEELIAQYLDYEIGRNLKKVTISGKRYCLYYFFEHIESLGIHSPHSITSKAVYSFLKAKTHFSVATKEYYQYILRDLFRYLHKENLCREELLELFSIISVHSKNSYPSYFSAEDISKVLQCIDTDYSIGKRDYLILLLASQLGLRVSDICSIKLDNIDFINHTLKFQQTKTGEFLALPLSDELLYALIDYLKNARPPCDSQVILIKSRAPIEPYNTTFYGMLQKYFALANIKISDNQKHGLHSFRSSLASGMLKNGTSMSVIANVLGHKYRETTRSYIKIDIPGLRKAALEVPYDFNR
ncbi:MAG: hypothetical protein COA82_12640 [Alkaliphilus sp.]|jgi:site-specific recombinase XerD|nr:tyrosine-type recombinase/integrase [bacterium AH-315-G05]PHS29462.1 MAG: hypothetical protein COA82_12640 [Alkaliphilus sp.]